jgi:hypothetical protein
VGLSTEKAKETVDCAALSAALRDRGFFSLSTTALRDGECAVPPGLVESLRLGVLRLVALGHSPSAIACFDEAWTLAACVTPFVSAVTGGLAPLGDWFTFLVSPDRPSGFTPHRDRALGGLNSFTASTAACSASASLGSEAPQAPMPKYATVWIALSEATPETSCLYFVPKPDDPGCASISFLDEDL